MPTLSGRASISLFTTEDDSFLCCRASISGVSSAESGTPHASCVVRVSMLANVFSRKGSSRLSRSGTGDRLNLRIATCRGVEPVWSNRAEAFANKSGLPWVVRMRINNDGASNAAQQCSGVIYSWFWMRRGEHRSTPVPSISSASFVVWRSK